MCLLDICVTIIWTCVYIALFRFRVFLQVKLELFLEFDSVVKVHVANIEALPFIKEHLLLFIHLVLAARSLTKCTDTIVISR